VDVIVQKYGGSSLADPAKVKLVARRIARTQERGVGVVAVCSAMGDTTDDLLLLAHQITSRPDTRELDVLLSTGEMISCSLVAMALEAEGCRAVSLTGLQAGIQTESSFGRARIAAVEPTRILEELNKGKVVVVAGFQGVTDGRDITTLGRGGSDTSAVALAAALSALRCEIYTDVGGIYTADPRIVPTARKIDEIDYQEMLELASMGAKMQPRSIELGALYEVPIEVSSTFTEVQGTLIHGGGSMEVRNRVRGIAYDLNVAKITVRRVPDQPGIAASYFEALASKGISVDTIVQNTSKEGLTDLSFTVARTDLPLALEQVVAESGNSGGEEVIHDASLGKVSIVGTGMRNAPGFASRMFRSLADSEINIDMITTSEIRITCIINESLIPKAVQVLHDAFVLDNEEGEI